MKGSKYIPVPGEEEDDESTPLSTLAGDEDTEEAAHLVAPIKSESRLAERCLLVFAILSLLCSLGSLALLVLDARLQWRLHDLLGAVVLRSSPSTERPDPGLLERPSVYSALDKLPQDVVQAALTDTLDVFPPFFQPIDHIHREYVFPSDGHARFTFNGRVSPGDHRVLLTDHITMVAQFRVHDHGMERCRIVAAIPSWELLQERNQTLHLAGDTSRIEVWNVTAPGELDERTLSWATKPVRKEMIATVGADANATLKSDEFWCGPSGSLQTFELLCRGVSCYVELWQDYYFKPRFGIYVEQSPSL